MTNYDRKDSHNRVIERLPRRYGGTPLASPLRVVILMPLRDDWASAAELIRLLDQAISSYPCNIDVLLVDDGSVEACRAADFQSKFDVVRTIRVLRLRRNLGHQRAIAMGLVHVHDTMPCDAVLVMDSDGEDTAVGALELLRAFSGATAIFAERSKRTEPFVFRLFYQLYRLAHRMLTGISVRAGNFSILPSRYLGRLVVMSEVWNHYAAAVFRSGLPLSTIPIPRGYRITGTSKMNLVSLIAHGMSAISIYGDVVGVRLLTGSVAASLMAGMGIVAVTATRMLMGRAIPGWAVYSMGAIAVILLQVIGLAASFTLITLSKRTDNNFVPLRDHEVFVAEALDIYRASVAMPPSSIAVSGGSPA